MAHLDFGLDWRREEQSAGACGVGDIPLWDEELSRPRTTMQLLRSLPACYRSRNKVLFGSTTEPTLDLPNDALNSATFFCGQARFQPRLDANCLKTSKPPH